MAETAAETAERAAVRLAQLAIRGAAEMPNDPFRAFASIQLAPAGKPYHRKGASDG